MKYRKKPVVVEAVQLIWENWHEICDFMPIGKDISHGVMREKLKLGLDIVTLEGTMHANENDWIIKGINGEFYPCKPDIFEQTYEPVEETEKA